MSIPTKCPDCDKALFGGECADLTLPADESAPCMVCPDCDYTFTGDDLDYWDIYEVFYG